MTRDDYNNYGSSRRDYGDGRNRTTTLDGNTADFSTDSFIDEKEGSFFGIKVGQNMATAGRTAWNVFVAPWLGNFADRKAVGAGTALAKYYGKSELEAAKIGHKAGRVVGWAAVFAEPIGQLGGNVLQTTTSLNELRSAVAPVLKANNKNVNVDLFLGNPGNEVISNARSKIFSIATQRVVDTGVRTVGLLPAIMNRWSDRKANFKKLDEELEREDLHKNPTPEKIEKWVQKHGKTDLNSREAIHDVIGQYLRDAKVKYLQKYEAFKVGEEGQKIAKRLSSKISNGHDLEQALREHYSRIEKPWDRSWLPENEQYRNNIVTLKDQLEQGAREAFEGAYNRDRYKEKERDHKYDEAISNTGFGALSTLASEGVANLLGSRNLEKLKGNIALDLVLNMRRALDGDEMPESIALPENEAARRRNSDLSFVQYVHEVFERNQHDSGKPEIGERFFQNFKEKNWNDNAIFKMDDKDLSTYEYAVKHIAHRIKTGRMDALALVNLVGERKICNKSGKSFGAQGKQGDDALCKKGLLAEIEKQTSLFKPKSINTNNESANSLLADVTFSEEELRTAFSPSGLKGEERMFMFALVDSNVTDEKKLRELTGLEQSQIEGLRKESQGRFTKLVDAAVVELANSPELIEKAKLTKEEVETIKALAGESCRTGKPVEDLITDKQTKKKVEETLASALMKDSDKSYWQDLVKREREPKDAPQVEPVDAAAVEHHGFEEHKKHSKVERLVAAKAKAHASETHYGPGAA